MKLWEKVDEIWLNTNTPKSEIHADIIKLYKKSIDKKDFVLFFPRSMQYDLYELKRNNENQKTLTEYCNSLHNQNMIMFARYMDSIVAHGLNEKAKKLYESFFHKKKMAILI